MSLENAGQMCTSTERIFVHADIADAFEQQVVALARQYRVGRFDDPRAMVGPLINEAQRQRVLAHIDDAMAKGATRLLGRDEHPEHFVLPTVLTGITDDMHMAREETFGPVVAIRRYEDVDDAVRWANSTEYGLGAAVFGGNDAADVADRIAPVNVSDISWAAATRDSATASNRNGCAFRSASGWPNRCSTASNFRETVEAWIPSWRAASRMEPERYAARESCTSCHMPAVERSVAAGGPTRATRRHWWRGAGIPKFEGVHPPPDANPPGLDLHVERIGDLLRITATNARAGHSLPTGDPERWVQISVERNGSVAWSTRIGQRWQWWPTPTRLEDTRLNPGERRIFEVRAPHDVDVVGSSHRMSTETAEYHDLTSYPTSIETHRISVSVDSDQP